MAEKAKPAVKAKPEKSAEDYVAEYLGVHPKYLLFTGSQVTVDLWKLEHDGQRFDGFLPHLKEIGVVK